jgi:hypothetical protein
MSVKQAAEELLKIADDIEKEASEVTQFVCEKCNHTANLATINARRKEAAEASDAIAAEVTVNDRLACPACDGNMSYKETEASAPYYYDPDKEAVSKKEIEEEKKETPEEQAKEEKGEKLHKEPHTAADYDSI